MDHFRRLITSGELRPGERLPIVREVRGTWNVSVATATRAYNTLRAEGLTHASTGAGTVVATGSPTIATRVRTDASTGRALGRGEESRIIEIGITGADETVAPRLGVEQGTPVHVRRRVVSREGVPVHTSSSFYTADVVAAVPELAEPVSTGRSRELAAERLGSPQDRVVEEVTSRLATDPEKDALGLRGPGVIVTQVVRTVCLEDGRIVEVAVKVVSGSTVQSWSTPLR
ncbi:GntR family transcriptional regulator [Streptomyces avicenniae]|uniref:GntR family transcriptional regulator n=1 Tax=Streptomyces avicenniae TaxID=500153 RepID=UPI0021D7BA96|nr:GntR family transcriptional regulator [Streptomyces avicenniae]